MKLSDIIFRSAAFLEYRLKAKNAHGIHSPFVYSLYTECIRRGKKAPRPLRKLRKELKKNHAMIRFEDHGAGGSSRSSYEISISRIAKVSAKPEKYSMLLARLCTWLKAPSFLELGTSLGLSTAAVAVENPQCRIITIEGSDEVRKIAKENFSQLGLQNIDSRAGRFEDVLEDVLKEMGRVDMVFIDGNHRSYPTLQYFEMLLPYTHSDSVLIFDDIHWSKGMEKAWDTIIADPAVSLSVDLYSFGLIFFQAGRAEKEHFILRS